MTEETLRNDVGEEAAPAAAEVSSLSLEEFAPPGARPTSPGTVRNLGRVLDVSVVVSARVGAVRKRISEIVDLSPGAVIDLERAAGEPVDLLVGDKLIARGEIVVVDDHYGVRITEVVQDV